MADVGIDHGHLPDSWFRDHGIQFLDSGTDVPLPPLRSDDVQWPGNDTGAPEVL
jgi:hypothetical protein